MKEKELRKHTDCSVCGKKVLASGLPIFWTLHIERHGILMDAIDRQQGLTMMLGNSAALAAAMGPDEDMTMPVMDPVDLTLCECCAVDKEQIIAALVMKD